MLGYVFPELKKKTAGIFAVIMLVIVLSAAFFIASEADHDCIGEDCPVCACIQQCEQMVRRNAAGTVPGFAVAAAVLGCFAVAWICCSPIVYVTPVSIKIRMND